MSENQHDEDLEAFISKGHEDISDLRRGMAGSTKTRLTIWCFRWALGFGLIWLINWWTGRFDWLWTIGIIVATTSLIFFIAVPLMLSQKAARLEESLDELRNLEQEE